MKTFLMIFALIIGINSAFADSDHNDDGSKLTKVSISSKQETAAPTYSATIRVELGDSVKKSALVKVQMLAKIKQVTYELIQEDAGYPTSVAVIRLAGEKKDVDLVSSSLK